MIRVISKIVYPAAAFFMVLFIAGCSGSPGKQANHDTLYFVKPADSEIIVPEIIGKKNKEKPRHVKIKSPVPKNT